MPARGTSARAVAMLALAISLAACSTAGQPAGPMGPGIPGMMGGALGDQAGPGSPGFVAGTTSAPRIVRIVAGPGYVFSPSEVPIVAGETITFEVTTMGLTVHEFMVGPAADVSADSDAAPEIADIGMMETKSLAYTFDGPGPFAFACHEPGHFEAGMRGVITVAS